VESAQCCASATTRLYTAWDNLKDEGIFFRGVDLLEGAGIQPRHVMAYMLVAFWPDETLDRVLYRVEKMRARGILPYPMVFDCRATDPERYALMKRVQRWVVRGTYHAQPFSEYDPNWTRRRKRHSEQFELTPAHEVYRG
jgi:hypothetical protein